MTMTSDAKRALSKTIRELRAYLLEALHAAVETEYRFSIKRAQDADLDEARTARRRRFEGWIAEQLRAEALSSKAAAKKKSGRTAEDFRRDAEKQAAYTLLNRLVFLRLLEAAGLSAPHVVTGGWDSRGYRDFRELAPALVQDDPTEGYGFLLRLVFEGLAHDLPGLYGPAGVAELVPVGPAVLRRVIEALDDEALASCWTDDMTLGWVYQYWNDPERERLDDKLNPKKTWGSGKIEPHEIASKTQMFTERYMVDWLLQNSLGPMWLAMCRKHRWTPACEADGTLDALEARRAEWRGKRDAGEVELIELMPLHTDMERRWAYYVPQPTPDDAVEHAPETVRTLKILDPAVGSGHFLVVAFDLLLALYREEAEHRGEAGDDRWNDRAIVESILENNLHGIDLDPRAVQIAAAALWLKGKQACADAEPRRVQLVASNLRLAALPDDDPALVELRAEVERETGIPAKLTDQIVQALAGADHLGSLLKVDAAVDETLRAHEAELGIAQPDQGSLFDGFGERRREPVAAATAKAGLVERLERFLARRGAADDLGLRLRGEQLARGIRFLRLVEEGRFDLVVGNPPYQGTSKMADSKYVEKHYALGKGDLYAAFLLRGLELARQGGVSALLTMRNWMFIKQYAGLREHLLETVHLRGLHDLSSGAFEEISAAQVVVSVVSSIFSNGHTSSRAIAIKAFSDDTVTQVGETRRKRAVTLCQIGRHEFDPAALKVVPEWPLVYWWTRPDLEPFSTRELLGRVSTITPGIKTGDDTRFLRYWFEVQPRLLPSSRSKPDRRASWQFYMKGAAGAEWFEPGRFAIEWHSDGLHLKVYGTHCAPGTTRLRDPSLYFRPGVVFSSTGTDFGARAHRLPSLFGDKAPCVFADGVESVLCLLNSTRARRTLEALNPSIDFKIGDVSKLPTFLVGNASEIVGVLGAAFGAHESAAEASPEFVGPGASPWRSAQEWAQRAVDQEAGAPLESFEPEQDREECTDHISFGLGVSLGRFDSDGEGVLDPATTDLSRALPAGVLFLDGSLDTEDKRDSLGHPAAVPLHDAWTDHGAALDTKRTTVRDYLALDFFKDVHRQMYELRPIHWPLSSAKKTFVAWINIHRWDENTLRFLLAEHLHAAQARLDGELTDLRLARDGADAKAARKAEKRYDKVLKWREELAAFVDLVTQCAEKGPAPPEPKKGKARCPAREVDARYAPDLDDGVMINSAALWPLLEPQWKDPKKWYQELASAKGKKDYDWSHLAMRYWPTRVDAKCQEDPSLGVAHGCFWRYHPARAWAWELRLQDEIGPKFRIEEEPYDPPGLASGATHDAGDGPHRDAYLQDHAEEALAAVEKEANRRRGRGKDAKVVPKMRILESGLWSALAEACWELELRISEKQGAEFRLLAPDERDARAAFEAAHPDAVAGRVQLMKTFSPAPGLFDDEAPTDAETGGRSLEDVIAALAGDLGVSGQHADVYALAAVVRSSPAGIAVDRAFYASHFANDPMLAHPQLVARDASLAGNLEGLAVAAASEEFDWSTATASLEEEKVIVRTVDRYLSGEGDLDVSAAWLHRAELALAILDRISTEELAELIPLHPEARREAATGARTG